MNTKRGFFRNAVDALMAAREKQARIYVDRALLTMDDETLKAGGLSRSAVRRQGGRLPF